MLEQAGSNKPSGVVCRNILLRGIFSMQRWCSIATGTGERYGGGVDGFEMLNSVVASKQVSTW